MSESPTKSFDCVQFMRQARDQLSAQISGMSHDELIAWLRSHRYDDPVLQRLADMAAQRDIPGDPPLAVAEIDTIIRDRS